MSLTDGIKPLAYEAGFDAVGITSAEPFVEADCTLSERYEKGLLEGSGYEPDIIRLYTSPRESLLTARSIISVASSYLSDESEESAIRNPQSEMPRGWVARFARGLDYHAVLQERLSILAGEIRAKLGHHVEIRSYADTGPLVDRSAAIRAGIGSHGKNTCVYVGEHKSWVVLGELLTDVELEPEEPAPLEICGECDVCMKACPTGAICAPYVVDVKICLSQVTQSKGFIPHWLREKLGTRIYGCDTCQSACPLNNDAKPGNIDDFRTSKGLGENPELLPLLNISPEEFTVRVGPTTAGWIRRTRFRRNVAIALGNIGDPVAVPGLTEALSDPEPVIRGHAAWALGRIGGPARVGLESALGRETDEQVLGEIRSALG
jgi:epoxyqueuosine reductase